MDNKRYVLTITPNPCVDVTVFDDGRRDVQSGGKGLNVARVLNNLGAPVRALTFADDALAPLLAAEGIPALTLRRVVRTVTTYVGSDYAQRVDMRRGAPLGTGEADALYALFLAHVDGAALVLLGGALPGPLDRRAGEAERLYARIVQHCGRAKVPVWLDAHGPGVDWALAERPNYWKPNEQEWTRLTGRPAAVEEVRAWLRYRADETLVDAVPQTPGPRGLAPLESYNCGSCAFESRPAACANNPRRSPAPPEAWGDWGGTSPPVRRSVREFAHEQTMPEGIVSALVPQTPGPRGLAPLESRNCGCRASGYEGMTVLFTMGGKGAACITAEGVVERPAFAVDAINPVGSGDSFSAAFIWGLTRGLPVNECLRLGCAAGAANAAMFPAARIGWPEIEAVLAGNP